MSPIFLKKIFVDVMLKRIDTSGRFRITRKTISSIRSYSPGFLVLFFEKVALIFYWKNE